MNSKSKSINILSLVLSAATFIVPLVCIIIGVVFLLNGGHFTNLFAVQYFILPLLALVISTIIAFANSNANFKLLSRLMVLITIVTALPLFIAFGNRLYVDTFTGKKAVEKYNEALTEFSVLPSESELGQTNNLEYDTYCYKSIFSNSDSDYLICTYDDSDYKKCKKQINDKYIFSDTIDIKGYNFKILSFENDISSDLEFPQRFTLIATNDTTLEIVYLHYNGTATDSITEEFITNNCGWKYIR